MYTWRTGSGTKNTEQLGTGVSPLRGKNDREKKERDLDGKDERMEER